MQKTTFKWAGITACVFLLGWSGAVGYLSWQYDFDFSPWQKDEASVLPLTLTIFQKQCASENDALIRAVVSGDNSSSAYAAAYFGCLSARSDSLMYRLSLAVTGYSHVSCIQKAESEGLPDDNCKKALEERMLMHRSLKELSAEQ